MLFSWASKPSETGRPFFLRDAGKIKHFFHLIYSGRAQLSDFISDRKVDSERAISFFSLFKKYSSSVIFLFYLRSK